MQLQNKRRTLIKGLWAAPVLTAVSLPDHATASEMQCTLTVDAPAVASAEYVIKVSHNAAEDVTVSYTVSNADDDFFRENTVVLSPGETLEVSIPAAPAGTVDVFEAVSDLCGSAVAETLFEAPEGASEPGISNNSTGSNENFERQGDISQSIVL